MLWQLEDGDNSPVLSNSEDDTEDQSQVNGLPQPDNSQVPVSAKHKKKKKKKKKKSGEQHSSNLDGQVNNAVQIIWYRETIKWPKRSTIKQAQTGSNILINAIHH